MDCLGHYADLTSTVWAAICRTSACAKRFILQLAYIFILIVCTKTRFATEAKVNLGLRCSSMSCSGEPLISRQFFVAEKVIHLPQRGLISDGQDVPTSRRRTANQKNVHLELMLGQIANFFPVISRNSIVKNSTSVKSIWQAIRAHYGFQSIGAHFLDFARIKLDADERPEDLFQRLMSFIDDNLLIANSNTHHGDVITAGEELSPTLENLVVLTWLRLIHPDLPGLVKQRRYGT